MDREEVRRQIEETTCLYYEEPGARTEEGVLVRKEITDQWEGSRPVKKRFRVDSDNSLEDCYEQAVDWRNHVQENKDDINWLRDQFDEPKEGNREEALEPGEMTFTEVLQANSGAIEKDPDDPAEWTYQQWMARGLVCDQGGHWSEDPDFDESSPTGYLYRIYKRNSDSDFSQKSGCYRTLKESDYWDDLQNCTLEEISPQPIHSWIKSLENSEGDNGECEYAHYTIKKYHDIITGSIKEWANRVGVTNPLKGGIGLDPNRLQGRAAPKKARPPAEIAAMREGLIGRIYEASRKSYEQFRALTRWFFEIHVRTGARVDDLLHIEIDDVDFDEKTLDIRNLKRERAEQSNEAIYRTVPAVPQLLDAIDLWVGKRPDLDFPSIDDEPRVFAHPDGGMVNRDSICTHYKAACEYSDALTVKIRPRWIRHCVQQRLKDLGCPPSIIMALVGHKVTGIQGQYVDVTPAQTEHARPHLKQMWSW